jgi:hypothetical protein
LILFTTEGGEKYLTSNIEHLTLNIEYGAAFHPSLKTSAFALRASDGQVGGQVGGDFNIF